MANEQVNVPSLVVILVLSGLIIRYLFFPSPTPHQQQQQPRDSVSALLSREAAVVRIQQMFPQVDRRNILWDLQRNGGNIALTTERILSGRLETPPITFQPPPPPGSTAAGGATAHTSSLSQRAVGLADNRPAQKNIFEILKLEPPDGGDSASSSATTDATGGNSWSSDPKERQTQLQRKKVQMILEAHRKMKAKMDAENAAAASGIGGT